MTSQKFPPPLLALEARGHKVAKPDVISELTP